MTAPATLTIAYDRWRGLVRTVGRATLYTVGITDWLPVNRAGQPCPNRTLDKVAVPKGEEPWVMSHVRLTFIDDYHAAEFALRYA